jgi:hypothetical protein|tara:strand:+ start:56 stop:1033 length:978 start_codon:yes stop_codon:yes gene_type:complete
MGIGSKLKKLAKKIIPKEVSKAAPIVSIFNPGIGAALGAMGGLREGNIGKAALAGLANYGAGRFAQGLGAPSIGGNLSSGLGSILGNIPGVSQLAASPAGQGVGSFFDKVQAVGGQLGSGLGTRATPQSVGAPSADIFGSATQQGTTGQIQDILSSSLSEGTKKDLINNILEGDVIGTGGGGLFPQMSRGQMLKSLLGFGLGYFGDKQAEDEYEDMMNRTGFRDTLAQIQAQEASQLPEVKGLKAMANGGSVGFANGGEPAMEMDYRGGGFIPVGAKERADDVPARLSKNEFVMTADAVRAAGGGSVNKGAKKMYSLMNQLEARA